MVQIEINGQALQAEAGSMIIEVADKAGIRIPRFCYHKKLSVAANCRMCLVEVQPGPPKPMPACATPVAEGMKVQTRSKFARDAQKAVMEFLLINHPLDCPICDQGGECELQDVAMGYGRDISRFNEGKRIVVEKNLGPLIHTDMTRCIHCTRCVRFGVEIAGMSELGATGRGEDMEIGTFVEQSVNSEVSGNIIDLCPVGALTSKPFRYAARAWELTQADSIAPHDCLGSNIHGHQLRGRLLRVVPKENEAINEVWLSDRDRFSYQGIYSPDRVAQPMIRQRHEQGKSQWQQVDWPTALAFAAQGLKKICNTYGPEQLAGLISPSATLEEHYLLQKIVRGLGSNNIDHRLRQTDFSDDPHAPAYPLMGLPIAALEKQNSVLLIGSNIQKEQPLAGLRLRKAVVQRGATVAVINPIDFEFNFPVSNKIIVRHDQMPASLAGIAAALAEMKSLKWDDPVWTVLTGAKTGKQEKAIAESLQSSKRSSLLLGAMALNHPQAASLKALASLIAELSASNFGLLTEGANSAGAWMAGCVPHRQAMAKTVLTPGLHAKAILDSSLRAYVLFGVEPERDSAASCQAMIALKKAEFVLALSPFSSKEMDDYCDVILPVSTFAETSGTFVNAEGLWQSFTGLVPPVNEARPGWKVLRVLGNQLELDDFDYKHPNQVRSALQSTQDDQDNEGAQENSGPLKLHTPWQHLNSTDWQIAENSDLLRVSDVPLYSVDGLVRRATALANTADAQCASARINSKLALSLDLAKGSKVLLSQQEHQATLSLEIDDRVPEHSIWIASGTEASVTLGEAFGPIQIQACKPDQADQQKQNGYAHV